MFEKMLTKTVPELEPETGKIIDTWTYGKQVSDEQDDSVRMLTGKINVFLHRSKPGYQNGFSFEAVPIPGPMPNDDIVFHYLRITRDETSWRHHDLDCLFRTVMMDIENAVRYYNNMDDRMTMKDVFVLHAEELETSVPVMSALWKRARANLSKDSDDEMIWNEAMQMRDVLQARIDADEKQPDEYVDTMFGPA